MVFKDFFILGETEGCCRGNWLTTFLTTFDPILTTISIEQISSGDLAAVENTLSNIARTLSTAVPHPLPNHYRFDLKLINGNIEAFFKKDIVMPDKLYEKDLDCIIYVSEIIRGNKTTSQWSELDFSVDLTEDLQNKILSWNSKPFTLSYVGTVHASFWGETYTLHIIRQYICVINKDLDRLKQKATYLDIGDSIRLQYLPGDGSQGEVVDCINPNPELENV